MAYPLGWCVIECYISALIIIVMIPPGMVALYTVNNIKLYRYQMQHISSEKQILNHLADDGMVPFSCAFVIP